MAMGTGLKQSVLEKEKLTEPQPRQEQPQKPKRSRKKKESAPKELTYEQRSYIKIIGDGSVAWSTIWSPAIQVMLDIKLLETDKTNDVYTSRIRVSELGRELYEANKGIRK